MASSLFRPGQQLNPLLPGYSFNVHLVAGLTPIVQSGPLDFFIDRPHGMNGYIINLTIKGKGQLFEGEDAFTCEPGDLLMFPPDAVHYYGRAPDCTDWYHRWVYFRPRAYWKDWLAWPEQRNRVGFLRLANRSLLTEFERLFTEIDMTHKSGQIFAEELAINLLERLLLRCVQETSDAPGRVLDPRILEACQYLSDNLAQEIRLEDLAEHVCLSPSRLAHLFREQIGVNMLRWREDQRIIRAKQLLQTSVLQVSVIARMVGYDDQLYFSRVFRKRVGTSPTDYRRSSQQHLHQALETEAELSLINS